MIRILMLQILTVLLADILSRSLHEIRLPYQGVSLLVPLPKPSCLTSLSKQNALFWEPYVKVSAGWQGVNSGRFPLVDRVSVVVDFSAKKNWICKNKEPWEYRLPINLGTVT